MLFGDLNLDSIASVTYQELKRGFATITVIQGNLIITNNLDMVSLDFFSNLLSVRDLVIANNTQLVDARLVALETVGEITIFGNYRLCPSFMPMSLSSEETYSCGKYSISQLISYSGASLDEVEGSLISAMQAFNLSSV